MPITGQSLGVLLLGAALGTHRSVASVLAYLMWVPWDFPFLPVELGWQRCLVRPAVTCGRSSRLRPRWVIFVNGNGIGDSCRR